MLTGNPFGNMSIKRRGVQFCRNLYSTKVFAITLLPVRHKHFIVFVKRTPTLN